LPACAGMEAQAARPNAANIGFNMIGSNLRCY